MPLVSSETTGMMMSLTREVVILPKAPPMTTPTAISSTLPRMAKALNSSINFFMVKSSESYILRGMGRRARESIHCQAIAPKKVRV